MGLELHRRRQDASSRSSRQAQDLQKTLWRTRSSRSSSQNRMQLLKKESILVNGDTRYKQFMRWWDIMFGIPVPDSLEPLQVDTVS